MEILVYIGSTLAFIGLVGLVACIYLAVKIKHSGRDDADLRPRLQKLVAYNMAALLLSFLGLMMIVVGILL